MSVCAVKQHNSTVLRELEPGDMVEFSRGIYSHWAIYKGDGEVIHLAGDDNDGLNANVTSGSCFTICGRSFEKAFVKVDDFWKVAADCKAYRNNKKDKKQRPRPADEIIAEGLEKLGEIGYNLMWSNCEHFANFCRYGTPSSSQVENVFTTVTVAGAVALLAVGISYLFGSKDEKEKKRTA